MAKISILKDNICANSPEILQQKLLYVTSLSGSNEYHVLSDV